MNTTMTAKLHLPEPLPLPPATLTLTMTVPQADLLYVIMHRLSQAGLLSGDIQEHTARPLLDALDKVLGACSAEADNLLTPRAIPTAAEFRFLASKLVNSRISYGEVLSATPYDTK
jgi:hypothetical protein